MKKFSFKLLLLLITSNNFAQPGSFDATFGTGGKVITVNSTTDWAYASAIQNDGKIVIAGESNSQLCLLRYNSNGSLDNTFGATGIITNTSLTECNSITIQNDGKIIAVGSIYTGFPLIYKFGVVRYNSNGTLDNTFAIGGLATTTIGVGHSKAFAVKLQPDNKIVVAGQTQNGSYYDFAIARYNSNGTLDTGFGSGGIAINDIGTNQDYAQSIAIQNDGRIVVGGYYYLSGFDHNFAVVRYNIDGSLDSSFGSNGKMLMNYLGNDELYAIAIQPNGKIIMAGTTALSSGTQDFAIGRLNTNGSLDSSFGSGGMVWTRVSTAFDLATSVVLQNDGKILAGGRVIHGSSNMDFGIVRYNNDGSLDNTFNTNGILLSPIGTYSDGIQALSLQADNKIVAVGFSYGTPTSDTRFALSRYNNSVTSSPCSAYYSAQYDSISNNFTLLVNDTTFTTDQTIGYLWNFGDGTTSTLASPSHTYSVENIYNVCMTKYRASGDSCTYCHLIGKDSSGNVVRSNGFTVNVLNSNSVYQSFSICPGQNVIVGSHVYSNPGNYTDIFTSAVYGCDSIVRTNIIQNSAPIATITTSGSLTFCQGDSVVLNANIGAGYTYQWKRNGLNISGAVGTSYSVSTSGNYAVVVTNASSCSSTSSVKTVTVNPQPIATSTPGGPTTFCQGGSVTLYANTGFGLFYQWKKDGLSIPSANSSYYVATSSGNYEVQVSNFNCSKISPGITVIVNQLPPQPTIVASGPTVLCKGSSVTLNAGSLSGLDYQWNRNGVDIPSATLSTYLADTSGIYSVTVSNGLCAISSAQTVVDIITPLATIVAIGPTTFCQGDSVELNANSGTGLTYQWSKDNIAIPGASASSYYASLSGDYNVIVTNSGCDTISSVITVTVNSNPIAIIAASGSTDFCFGDSVNIIANSGSGYNYQWMRNGAMISGETDDTYRADTTGNYSVLITNSFSCSSLSSSVSVNTIILVASNNSSGSTFVCEGNTVLLNANTGSGLNYQWRKDNSNILGGTSSSYLVSSTGNYDVIVSSYGCSDTSSIIGVQINNLPSVSFNSIMTPLCDNSSSVLLSGLPLGGNFSGTGVVGSTFDPVLSGNGNFTLYYTVTDNNGCSNLDSQAVVVDLCSGISEFNSSSFSVFPNPLTDQAKISFVSVQENIIIAIVDIAGRKVRCLPFSGKELIISSESMDKGIYFIEIVDANKNHLQRRIIIQ